MLAFVTLLTGSPARSSSARGGSWERATCDCCGASSPQSPRGHVERELPIGCFEAHHRPVLEGDAHPATFTLSHRR